MVPEDEDIFDEDYEAESEEDEDPERVIDPIRREKLDREALELADLILSAPETDQLRTITQRVAYILSRYPAARDSDITLQSKYWRTFQNFRGDAVSVNDLYTLERLTSISRARAKIQNEYGLYGASPGVRRGRRKLEDAVKEAMLEDQTGHPTLQIFCDESGKNQDYLMVGSVWLLDVSQEVRIRFEIRRWTERNKERMGRMKEFHFQDIDRRNLEVYKDFFSFVVDSADMMSFQAVMANRRSGQTSDAEKLRDLQYQLIRSGIEHETATRRVSLPRNVIYVKDKEDEQDELALQRLKQHLEDMLGAHYGEELTLGQFYPLGSEFSPFIQIADLFAGSINRVVNVTNAGDSSPKAQFASFALQKLGIDAARITEYEGDMVRIQRFG